MLTSVSVFIFLILSVHILREVLLFIFKNILGSFLDITKQERYGNATFQYALFFSWLYFLFTFCQDKLNF